MPGQPARESQVWLAEAEGVVPTAPVPRTSRASPDSR